MVYRNLFARRKRARTTDKRNDQRLRLENLEPRLVLFNGMVISEFMASNSATLLDGDGAASDWVEIHNPTAAVIDLTGWHLTDDVAAPTKWTFPSQSIAAGGHLVVFASGQAATNYVDPAGFLHTNFKLGAGGEYLGLYDAAGTVAFEFAPEFPAQSTDISYGFNQFDEPVYFTDATPGSVNNDASSVTVNVSISEIMYHPASEIDAEEYIEIYNAESTAIDLTGWTLSGAVTFDFPVMTLASGEYLVIASDVPTFSDVHPTVANVVGGWAGTLSNSTEELSILNAGGVSVDRVEYADAGHWATRERGPEDRDHEGWIWSDAHDGGGSSLEVVQIRLPNNVGQNWAASIEGGTPGAANSAADANGDSAPLIVGTAHSPVIPASTDAVIVTTRLVDELATGLSANVLWRVDGDTNFASLNMSDNGAGNDVTAGDGLFTAAIPPQADGAVVEWYVSASDTANNERTFPAATSPSGLQEANLLYQVDDSFDPNTLPAVGDMPSYRLIMTEEERAELEEIGDGSQSEAESNAQMNATFIAVTPDGFDIRYNVGMRNRGNGSRNNPPNNIRVNIPSDAPWQGIDQFNLNTRYTHVQLAGLKLYADAGLVAEDAKPVVVHVNGVNLAAEAPAHGVYIQVEANNGEFTRNHFPDDGNGNLYRGSQIGSPNGDLAYLGPAPEDYLGPYFKKTNESQDDWSDLIRLTEVLNLTNESDYLAQVEKVVDVDQWLGYFATIAILGSRETSLGAGVGDDYLLYLGENDPRAVLIPHDFDTVLGLGDTSGDPLGSIHRATNLPTVERFLTHPEIAPLFHAKFLELLNTTFAKENFEAIIDEHLTSFAPADDIVAMKEFMDIRREFIISEVTSEMTANSGLPVVGGFGRTTDDFAGIFGTAPLAATRSVLVNGEPASLDPFTGEWNLGDVVSATVETFIAESHAWSYLDAGQQPPSPVVGADWRIDDPGWTTSGPAPLGYSDGDIVTETEFIDIDLNTDGTQKNTTTYFRTTFDVPDTGEFTALELSLRRDDGVIIYLNGTETVRSNMPDGPIDASTLASSSVSGGEEDAFFQFSIDPTLLIPGAANVIAVELHQSSLSSSDTIFDLRLRGTIGETASTTGVSLRPGINRIDVQAFDGPNGTGNLVDTTFVDVWHDTGNSTAVSGPITSDTTWTAADSPYVVSSDVDVTDGVLTVEPGTTVFLDPGVAFTVSGNGQVIAEGTPTQRIRFSHNPFNGSGHWDGLNFNDTATDNRFRYVDFQSGEAQGRAVDISYGRVLFDNVSWFDINDQVIDMVHPNLIVRNSSIPGISSGETIHLVGLDAGEQLVFENNVIGKNTSGGDVVDMAPDSLNRGTIYFINNTFLGGFDDGVDTDGNIVIFDGNTFTDFHLNADRTTTSNSISSGHQDVGDVTLSSDLTIRNNTFYDVDHAVLLKDFSYALIENNTIVKATVGGIQFQELNGSSVIGPGLGADLDSNIFWETPLIFEAIHADTQLTYNRSFVTPDLVGQGIGNLSSDPLLADPANGDFRLTEGSPALFAGVNGGDIGAIQMPRHPAANATNLQITELHYNPLAGSQIDPQFEIAADGDWFEFIELYNYGTDTIDMSNVSFADGVNFTFDWGTTVAAGERVLIVKNLDVFESRYGTGLPIAGEYSGKLANSGEDVILNAADGSTIASISYGDKNVPDWPAAADGDGPSLELVSPGAADVDYSAAASWKNGLDPHGTPGLDNSLLACDYVNVGDGCDIQDLNALYAGTNGAPTPLNNGLILRWLEQASLVSNPAKPTPAVTFVMGDANLDGEVDSTDLGLLLNRFGANDHGWGNGNLNSDQAVDSTDLGLLLNNFGHTSFAAATSVELAKGIAEDTNSDGFVSPIDALAVIDYLSSTAADSEESSTVLDFANLDVNNDGIVSPIDALAIINRLNRDSATSVSTETTQDQEQSLDANPEFELIDRVFANVGE